MGNTGIIVAIAVCIGLVVWWRRREQVSTAAIPEGKPSGNSALKPFAHGNTCLSEGKFDEATAAFQQALELDPKHPHIAGRLAEVERQKAASAAAPDKLTG